MSNTRPIWSSSTSGVDLGSSDHQTPSNSSTMSSPNNPNPQEWCIHAQLTIRHPTASKMIVRPAGLTATATTAALADDNLSSAGTSERTFRTREGNLHFECHWENSGESVVTEVVPIESGIQKFESWLQAQPPLKVSSTLTNHSNVNNNPLGSPTDVRFPLNPPGHVNSSGQNPVFSSLLKPRLVQPYERRCKSTCSITLTSNNSNATMVSFENRCGSVESERASSLPPVKPTVPVKDAETQTVNLRAASQPKVVQKISTTTNTTSGPSKPGECSMIHDKSDSIMVPPPSDAERLNFSKPLKNGRAVGPSQRLSRKAVRSTSQCRAKSSPPAHHQQQQQQQKSNQPRTIHIDVYCTGSDVSTNTEDNSSSDDSTSTPQTVYESAQYKIAHHCKKKQMPLCFSSNVAELVNLATNQVKLQQHHRQDKGGRMMPSSSSSAAGGKVPAGNLPNSVIQPTNSSVGLDHARTLPSNKSNRNPNLSEGMIRRDFLGRDVTKNLRLDNTDTVSYCDSLSTSYPSSLGISRNTTATSFSSDWTQVDLNDVIHPQHGDGEEGIGRGGSEEIDEGLSQEFLFSSKSRSLDSVSMAKSYEYSDSLEGSPYFTHNDENSQHSIPNPERSEQWWMDYVFKKFNLKDRENIKLLGSPLSSQRSRPVGKETTNLIKMKRLSFPNCDLVDGLNTEDIMLPPFMPVVPSEADQGDTLLVTATKFGSVVKGFKKPGHHITGPAKNPNCPCQHCRYHFEEKEESGGV